MPARGGRGKVRHLIGWHRAAEKIALSDIAAQCRQHFGLRCFFDTFGNDFQAKVVRQLNDRGGDRCVLVGSGQVVDELPVDLQRVQRELLQSRPPCRRKLPSVEVIEEMACL